MLFRTGNANLRANRYSGSEARCILCASREPENQEHVLFRCRLYEAQRAELHHDLELVWGTDKTNKWKALGELQRAAYVLTNDQHDRRSERAVDAAIKKMLIQVEEVLYCIVKRQQALPELCRQRAYCEPGGGRDGPLALSPQARPEPTPSLRMPAM
jgi:hypothetical protein